MELNEIKYTKCPVCRAKTVSIRQGYLHSNGHYRESIEFNCGSKLTFSPNFLMIEIDVQCPNHSDEIIKREKRIKARKLLEKYIKKLDVDIDFKNHINIYKVNINEE